MSIERPRAEREEGRRVSPAEESKRERQPKRPIHNPAKLITLILITALGMVLTSSTCNTFFGWPASAPEVEVQTAHYGRGDEKDREKHSEERARRRVGHFGVRRG